MSNREILRAIGTVLLHASGENEQQFIAASEELKNALHDDHLENFGGVVHGPVVTIHAESDPYKVEYRAKTFIGKKEFGSKHVFLATIPTDKALQITLEEHARDIGKQLVARFHEQARVETQTA